MALGSRGRRSAEERPVVAGTSKVVDAVVVSIRSSVIGSSLASTEMAKNKMPAVSVRALFFVGFVHRRFISFAAKGRFDCFHGRTPLLFPRKNNKNQVSLNGFHPFFPIASAWEAGQVAAVTGFLLPGFCRAIGQLPVQHPASDMQMSSRRFVTLSSSSKFWLLHSTIDSSSRALPRDFWV